MEHCYWALLYGYASLLETIQNFSNSVNSEYTSGLSLSIPNQESIIDNANTQNFQNGIKIFLLGVCLLIIFLHFRSGEGNQSDSISSSKLSKWIPWGSSVDNGTPSRNFERRNEDDDDYSSAI